MYKLPRIMHWKNRIFYKMTTISCPIYLKNQCCLQHNDVMMILSLSHYWLRELIHASTKIKNIQAENLIFSNLSVIFIFILTYNLVEIYNNNNVDSLA